LFGSLHNSLTPLLAAGKVGLWKPKLHHLHIELTLLPPKQNNTSILYLQDNCPFKKIVSVAAGEDNPSIFGLQALLSYNTPL